MTIEEYFFREATPAEEAALRLINRYIVFFDNTIDQRGGILANYENIMALEYLRMCCSEKVRFVNGETEASEIWHAPKWLSEKTITECLGNNIVSMCEGKDEDDFDILPPETEKFMAKSLQHATAMMLENLKAEFEGLVNTERNRSQAGELLAILNQLRFFSAEADVIQFKTQDPYYEFNTAMSKVKNRIDEISELQNKPDKQSLLMVKIYSVFAQMFEETEKRLNQIRGRSVLTQEIERGEPMAVTSSNKTGEASGPFDNLTASNDDLSDHDM